MNSLEKKFCEDYYKFKIFSTDQKKKFEKSEHLNRRKIGAFSWERAKQYDTN